MCPTLYKTSVFLMLFCTVAVEAKKPPCLARQDTIAAMKTKLAPGTTLYTRLVHPSLTVAEVKFVQRKNEAPLLFINKMEVGWSTTYFKTGDARFETRGHAGGRDHRGGVVGL